MSLMMNTMKNIRTTESAVVNSLLECLMGTKVYSTQHIWFQGWGGVDILRSTIAQFNRGPSRMVYGRDFRKI